MPSLATNKVSMNFRKAHRRTVEEAVEMVREKGVEDEETGDENHGPADRPAGRLEHEHDQDAADDQVRRVLVAQAQLERLDIPDRIDLDKEHQRNEQQIDAEARDAQPVTRIAGNDQRVADRLAKQREHEDRQRQHDGQVHGAERTSLRRAERRDVEMENGERDRNDRREQQHRLDGAVDPAQQQSFEKAELVLFVIGDAGRFNAHGAISNSPQRYCGGSHDAAGQSMERDAGLYAGIPERSFRQRQRINS